MSVETMSDWRETNDIVECNRQMLQQQYACDVYFLLGDAHARQGAHKYMLISRSAVFAAMFCGALQASADEDIEVPDVEPGAFLQLLRYIYTGEAELTADNVLPVLYAANKYHTSGLARACVSFVEDRLDVENACALMEQAHLFNEQDFRSRVLELILRQGEKVLESAEVAELCADCLVSVVSSDTLICREDQVLQAVDRWAERECERRGLESSDSNRRILLGPALYHVRLPLLKPQLFVDKVVSRSLLSEEEKVDVMRHFLVPAMRSECFSGLPRIKEKQLRLNRFDSRNPLAWNNKSGDSAISFMTNRDILLEGFTIYGTCRGGNHTLKVKGGLLDSTGKVLASITTDVSTDNNVDIYDVLLDKTVHLTKNAWYTLAVEIMGSHTYAGTHGRLNVFVGEVVFTFSNSEKSQTGTCIEQGQLPGLLFTL